MSFGNGKDKIRVLHEGGKEMGLEYLIHIQTSNSLLYKSFKLFVRCWIKGLGQGAVTPTVLDGCIFVFCPKPDPVCYLSTNVQAGAMYQIPIIKHHVTYLHLIFPHTCKGHKLEWF